MKVSSLKVNQFLLFWILLVIILIYGRPILIPISFAAFLSMLMSPLIDFLDRKGLKRVFSTIVCIIILLAVIVLIGLIIVGQVSGIKEDLPVIEERVNELIMRLHDYIEASFDYSVNLQQEYLKEQVSNLGTSSGNYLTKVLAGASNFVMQTIITLVVTFLLLFDKEKYRSFFMR